MITLSVPSFCLVISHHQVYSPYVFAKYVLYMPEIGPTATAYIMHHGTAFRLTEQDGEHFFVPATVSTK